MKHLAAIDIRDLFFRGKVTGSKFQEFRTVADMVSLVLNTVFVVSSILLLFYFLMGGYAMISTAGKGDAKAAEQAKATVSSAVIGFVIVFASYWIVKLLLRILGMPDLI